MKKNGLLLILAALMLLCGCGKGAEEQAASIVQTEEEKTADYGSVFAHTEAGDFYSRFQDGQTVVTCVRDAQVRELAILEGSWRFSPVTKTQVYAYELFDGYKESEQGYSGCVYMYVEQTGVFAPVFDGKTSNAVLLPTEDENYCDLAWVLVQTEEDVFLCPINLRDGGTEMGQVVSLKETDYVIDGENVLVTLKTDTENPLKLRIENKAYAGSSVLPATVYVYDFEKKELLVITEEAEQNENQ